MQSHKTITKKYKMEVLGKSLLAIAIILLTGLLIALPVMWLWNWLMPDIFGLIKIGFWKALGLSLLCSFLFKSSNNK